MFLMDFCDGPPFVGRRPSTCTFQRSWHPKSPAAQHLQRRRLENTLVWWRTNLWRHMYLLIFMMFPTKSASGIDEQRTWLAKTRDWIMWSLLFTSQLSWDQLICMEDSLLARRVAIANQQSSCSILPANWSLGVMEVWCQGCRYEKVKPVAQQNCEGCNWSESCLYTANDGTKIDGRGTCYKIY